MATKYRTDNYPYKVYTALLTQSGGDNNSLISNNPLTIGVTYLIDNNEGGTADFTNVGAPNNNNGTYFVATGNNPNSWGATASAELIYNTGAPVVTILENTIGNIWFTIENVGLYVINSNNLFNGTIPKITNVTGIIEFNKPYYVTVEKVNDSRLKLWSWLSDGSSTDNDLLTTSPIEIRVYN